MKEKPLSFVILENDKVKLNEEVLTKIKMAKNPHLWLFYGTTTRKNYNIKFINKRK